VDRNYSWVNIWNDMYNGKVKGLFAFGMNGVAIGPDSQKNIDALKKADWLVVGEIYPDETSEFWKSPGITPEEMKKINTTVYRLPAAGFAEKDGTFVNSARWLQWKNVALPPPGQAKLDQEILATIFLKVRELYKKEGGKFPDPILNTWWPYTAPYNPSLAELAKEINGKALADLTDPKTAQVIKAGQQLPGFAWLKDDGTTLSGNWLYCGSWTEAGAMTQRRGTDDPSGLGLYPNWAWSWPANRRGMYNRASCDVDGKPWDPSRRQVWWDEGKQLWVGNDVPDFKADSPPKDHMGPFIMNQEGLGRLFVWLNDGPFPEHYEPIESPTKNLLSTRQNNPVAKIWQVPDHKNDLAPLGSPEYPYVITTYRLTEHHLSGVMSRYLPMLAELFESHFAEISNELAAEIGITNGDRVTVSSPRGKIHVKAMVTHRLKPFMIDGRKVHQIGVPWHWGWNGIAKGDVTNDLSATVADPTVYIQETKAFLCNVQKGEV
jgi:formate dehydrogenase major subunit